MSLPRDLSSHDVIRALSRYGDEVVRQTGSHIRLKTTLHGEHSVTIPAHDPVRVGTLNAIARDVAAHHGKTKSEAINELFEEE